MRQEEWSAIRRPAKLRVHIHLREKGVSGVAREELQANLSPKNIKLPEKEPVGKAVADVVGRPKQLLQYQHKYEPATRQAGVKRGGEVAAGPVGGNLEEIHRENPRPESRQ